MNTEHLCTDRIDDTEDELEISSLSQFTLLDDESRREFLFAFYWIGEPALFAAVSHVWDRLAEPRAWRCTHMGQLSGAGGQGKTALLLTLQKFLEEALAGISVLPDRIQFASLEDWHAASMQSFADDERDVAETCRRYASFMNGDDPIIPLTW